MKIITQFLLITGFFILITTSTLPNRDIIDYIGIGGTYSQTLDEQRTYQMYPGQVITITIASNFTLNVQINVYFKNSSEISKDYLINNVTLYKINGTFPFHLFSKNYREEEIRFDQIAEITITAFYSPDLIFFSENESQVSTFLYPVNMFGRIFINVTKRDYSVIFLSAWILIFLAAVVELTFLLLLKLKRFKHKSDLPSIQRKLYFPFLNARFLDEIFVIFNIFLLNIFFKIKGNLFLYVLYTDTYSFPLDGNNIWIQSMLILQSIIGIGIYGNMDKENLVTFWSLPISKSKYVSISELGVILRIWLFALFNQAILSWYTFAIVYSVPLIPLAILKTTFIQMRYSLLVISVSYVSLVFFQDILRGLTASVSGFLLLFVFFTHLQLQSIHKYIFASTDVTGGQALSAWLLNLFVVAVGVFLNLLLVRRYQIR